MIVRSLSRLLPILVTVLLCASCARQQEQENVMAPVEASPPLFSLQPFQVTQIDFVNELTEGLNTNILMYEYFYNGGGVAAGDLNGDGLIDLYFVSNMGSNKVYLNKGSLSFQDITERSGASGREGPWKTGVSIADINGDGKADIYVCYSGSLPDEKRVNQLFINKGNNEEGVPVFEEKAEEYGLASAGYSNQIYFFDYDKDGDLDAILLNHNPQSLPVLNEVSTAEFLRQDDPLKGVRVFRNTNNHFEDVTVRVGVSGSALTYGLGVGIADFNSDGWPDFYVSNDYTVPDYLYINNGNGTFTNRLSDCVGHNSQFSMGNDVADVNNDGLIDIVTLDMLPEDNERQKLLLSPDNYAKFELNLRTGFHYQYMRNMLQVNNGNNTFSEVGQLAGISNTDWSWAALLADYDNDGDKDLFVSNGYLRDYTNLDFIKYMDDYVKVKGRLMREDVLEIIGHMPASNVVNYLFSNSGNLSFTNETKAWGMFRTSNSNGAAYADLDNDGDLDLVVNNINQPAFIYRNDAEEVTGHHFLNINLVGTKGNTQGIGARVEVRYEDNKQTVEQQMARGYLSSVTPVLHFGLASNSKVDTLTVRWPNGKEQVLIDIRGDTTITLYEKDAVTVGANKAFVKPYYEEVSSPVKKEIAQTVVNDFKRQPLLVNPMSFEGPCMAKGDVNGDGREDIFVGGDYDQPGQLFFAQANGTFRQVSVPDILADKESVDAKAVFFDANNDGHLDLYVASGGYHNLAPEDILLQDRLYINDGKGMLSKSESALPEMKTSTGCVAVSDVNSDGYPDLFVGGRVIPGRYPESPRSYILINDGHGSFADQTPALAPALEKPGMVTSAVWIDVSGDEVPELVLAGEWMPVTLMGWENGVMVDQTDKFFAAKYSGWWNTLIAEDVTGDGKMDLIVGNMGLNTQFRVHESQPAEMFYKDVDNNGSVDPFFCYYIQGKSYPFLTRDELIEQLGSMRAQYPTFKSFSSATLHDVFKTEDLGKWDHLMANTMETSLFVATAGGFVKMDLPIEAQYAPVYTTTTLDFNNDGIRDLLLCGNINHAKIRMGKFDANYGVLLQGNGGGSFSYVDQSRSGFKIKGDVRSAMMVNNLLLFGVGQQGIIAYKRK